MAMTADMAADPDLVARRRARRERLCAVGRHVVAAMCVGGLPTGSMLFNANLFGALHDWVQSRRLPPPAHRGGPDQGWVPNSPRPVETLIPHVPLSLQERELWADLLDGQDSPLPCISALTGKYLAH
jgi:hypothetical protein